MDTSSVEIEQLAKETAAHNAQFGRLYYGSEPMPSDERKPETQLVLSELEQLRELGRVGALETVAIPSDSNL